MSRLFLLLVAALKFGKLVPTVLSMLIAIGAYALLYGWRYAVGFVAMLLIHEMGHYVAARQRGLHVGLPTFIPFVGAWVELKTMPHDAETEAYVGLAGPMLGTVGAIGAWWLARDDGPTWLLAVAYAGFMINLFNLIPLPPMDGGRITAVLSPRIWLLGVPILGWMLLTHFSPILLIVAILAVPHVFAAFRFDRAAAQAQGYYDVPARTRWEYGLIYVGLIAFLAYMTNDIDRELRGGRPSVTQSPSATSELSAHPMKTPLRALAGAMSAALLAGCTTIETAQLPDTLATTLQGQPVAIVVQSASNFGVMRERAVGLGPAGIPLMIAQGEHLRKSAGIVDPADGIATSLGELLARRHGAALMPTRGATSHDEPESIVAAAPPDARYVLTVATVSWGLARFPIKDATYSVTYVARARLIDARTKAVIAEGGCLQAPDGSEFESKDYGDFTADGAAVIKSELARRTERCLHFITRDMLGA